MQCNSSQPWSLSTIMLLWHSLLIIIIIITHCLESLKIGRLSLEWDVLLPHSHYIRLILARHTGCQYVSWSSSRRRYWYESISTACVRIDGHALCQVRSIYVWRLLNCSVFRDLDRTATQRSFVVTRPNVWNFLPDALRILDSSLTCFKRTLTVHCWTSTCAAVTFVIVASCINVWWIDITINGSTYWRYGVTDCRHIYLSADIGSDHHIHRHVGQH